VPRLCELYPGICLTAEEKARKKKLNQGSFFLNCFKNYIFVNWNWVDTRWQQYG